MKVGLHLLAGVKVIVQDEEGVSAGCGRGVRRRRRAELEALLRGGEPGRRAVRALLLRKREPGAKREPILWV